MLRSSKTHSPRQHTPSSQKKHQPPQQAPRSEGGGRGLYGVRPGDEAFALASANARQMAGLSAPVAGCTQALDGPAGSGVLARPGGACIDTRVRGLAGTGREGPACGADVDECVRGTHDCGAGSTCVNTDGAFRCVCAAGYVRSGGPDGGGDGSPPPRCDPAPGLATIADAYESDGPGKAQCGGGPLLPWPATAPGARPNPLGGGGGAGGNPAARVEPYGRVTLGDCLLACDAAPGCEVADFNAAVGRCRLRGGGGSRETCDAVEPDSTETDQSLEPMVFSNGAWESHFRKAGAGRVGGGAAE
jgi:mannan endo-1,4-beta-mannosidase